MVLIIFILNNKLSGVYKVCQHQVLAGLPWNSEKQYLKSMVVA